MWDPSGDVGRCEAAAELVVAVPEGRLVETVEHEIDRRVKRCFDRIVGIVEV